MYAKWDENAKKCERCEMKMNMRCRHIVYNKCLYAYILSYPMLGQHLPTGHVHKIKWKREDIDKS